MTNAAGEEIEWDEEDFLPEKISDQLKERTAEKNNPFKVGWKLEAVDLMDPKLICPSTVKVCAFLKCLDRINDRMFALGCCKSGSTVGETTLTSSFLGARPTSTRLAGANWSTTACKLRKKLRIYQRLQNGKILFLDCKT